MKSSETRPFSRLPIWPSLQEEQKKGFLETWGLQATDPGTQRSIWITLNIHSSQNGFRRVVEVRAVVSHRKESRDVSRLAIQQTHDLSQLSASGSSDADCLIRIADCELGPDYFRGSATSQGRTIRWDLRFQAARMMSFDFVPEALSKTGALAHHWLSAAPDLRVSGTTELDGELQEWRQAPGSLWHRAGPREWHSWVHGHCNAFRNEQGDAVDFVFEGLSASPWIVGGLRGPRLNTFLFVYGGKAYRFNSVWDALRNRSRHGLTEWSFEAERGDLSFRGQAKAEHRDFAGLSQEDTDGSLLYFNLSKLADLKILVYRRGKLEQTLLADGLASLEIASREKNPYVPLLL